MHQCISTSVYQCISVSVDLEVKRCKLMVIISMMVLCNAVVIIKDDRRRSRIPNAPLHMKHDNNSIE